MAGMSTMTETGIIPEWTQGDRLAKALRANGMTNQAMADFLGVSRNTISNYIHDKAKVPPAVLRIWAMKTGLPLKWLVTGELPEDGDDPNDAMLPWFDSNEQPSGYTSSQVVDLWAVHDLVKMAA